MTIEEFLAARLDEDEHAAKMAADDASASANWHVEAARKNSGYAGISGENGEIVVYDDDSLADVEARHIARHDPARVLREVEAKRKHLAAYRASVRQVGESLSVPARRVVEADAAVYSDHPDYDE